MQGKSNVSEKKSYMRIVDYFKFMLHILRSSISSPDFYKDVYYTYKGYGIKFLMHICFVVAFINSFSAIYYLSDVVSGLRDYSRLEAKSRAYTNAAKNLIDILSQWQDADYDGKEMHWASNEIYIISANNNKVPLIAIIPPDANTDDKTYIQAPIRLFSDRMVIDHDSLLYGSFKFDVDAIAYQSVLGNESMHLNKYSVCAYVADIIEKSQTFAVILVFCIVLALNFGQTLLEATVFACILFAVIFLRTKHSSSNVQDFSPFNSVVKPMPANVIMFQSQVTFAQCLRLATFSSAFPLLVKVLLGQVAIVAYVVSKILVAKAVINILNSK